jgi:hypothetical protein
MVNNKNDSNVMSYSNSNYVDEDSEDEEDMLLKKSYDEYGKMLECKNFKKNKQICNLLEIVEEPPKDPNNLDDQPSSDS